MICQINNREDIWIVYNTLKVDFSDIYNPKSILWCVYILYRYQIFNNKIKKLYILLINLCIKYF